jgi:hypothetical protein
MPTEIDEKISEIAETVEDKDTDYTVIQDGVSNFKKSALTRKQGTTEYVENNLKPFRFKGEIAIPSDFPAPPPNGVKDGWQYKIIADVIDNDPIKTNTGQEFNNGDSVFWDNGIWRIIASGSKIEQDLSGLISGGTITQAGLTTFNVSEGYGQIINRTSRSITPVSWPAFSNITPDYLTSPTDAFSFIYIDSAGELQQQAEPFTPELYKTAIPIGVVAHIYQTAAAIPATKFVVSATNSFRRLITSIGAYGAEEAYDLTTTFLQKVKYVPAVGLKIGINEAETNLPGLSKLMGAGTDELPNYVSIPNVPILPQLLYVYRNPDEIPIAYPDSFPVPTGDIKPDQYNPKGFNLVDIEEGFWSVQRALLFPNGTIPVIMFGRATYPTKREAMNNFNKEEFNFLGNSRKYLLAGGLITYIVIKQGATDLTDPNQAEFIPAEDQYGVQEIDTINSGLIVGGEVTDVRWACQSFCSVYFSDYAAK